MSYAQAVKRRQTDDFAAVRGAGAQTLLGKETDGGLSNSVIQTKLMVGGAQTSAEQEADRVAQQITGGVSHIHEPDASLEESASEMGADQMIQRQTGDGEDGAGFAAGADISDSLSQSAGRTLDERAGERIGSRLGADFSGVQVHTDQHAQRAAAGMHARAFTRGRDIYFNRGQYNPGTSAGQELLAHELTHTIQQGAVSQHGGIPVSETASAQTAQRGFFDVRKHFRKAVDERNMYYDDYKKQSKWERLKWAAKNPLAWAFGRSKANQQNTAKRATRQQKIADFAGNLDWLSAASDYEREGIKSVGREASKDLLSVGNQYKMVDSYLKDTDLNKIDGKTVANVAVGVANSLMENGSSVAESLENWVGKNGESGTQDTVETVANILHSDKLQDMNTKIGDHMSSDAAQNIASTTGASLGIGSNFIGMVTGGMETYDSFEEAKEQRNNGDYLAALSSTYDAMGNAGGVVGSAGNIVQNALSLAGKSAAANLVEEILPGVDIFTGGMKMASAGSEIVRTQQIKNRTSDLRDKFEADMNNDKLTEADKMNLRLQSGFMNMGHLQARADQTRAGFNMASGALEVGSGAASLAGAEPVGKALSLAAKGTEAVGGLYSDYKENKLKKAEVDRVLHMEAEIQRVLAKAKEAGLADMTKSEARHIVLARYGYSGRKEAYMDLAKRRMGRLDELGNSSNAADKEVHDQMVNALNLDPAKADAATIYKRVGVELEGEESIDDAIESERLRKRLPSFLKNRHKKKK